MYVVCICVHICVCVLVLPRLCVTAWQAVQVHANALSNAFMQRIVLQSFIEGTEGLQHASSKQAVQLLRCMYALQCMEKDTWYAYTHAFSLSHALTRTRID